MKNFLLFFLFSFFIEGVFGESVSVTEGDSVTLHTGLTEIQEDDVLDWRFGAGGDRIAIVRKGSDPTTYNEVLGGRFKGRLKPNGQTGDLTITNITTDHAGTYEISIKTINFKRNFSVIVVSDEKKPSVLLGEYVTLPTGVTDTKMYDVIQWRFGEKKYPIAKVNKKTGEVSYDVHDKRFSGRLQLDYWTGSLTITDTIPEHTGVYEVDLINSSKYTIHKTFSVTVRGKIQSVSLMEGETITLHTDAVLQTHDTALWMFGDTFMVSIQINNIIDVSDERFRDRLELDKKTGSLTITNTRPEHSGEYDVKISSSKKIIHKKFIVTVTDPGLSPGAIAGIVVGVLLVYAVVATAAAAGVNYYRRKISELKARIDKWRIQSVMEGERITLNPDDTKVHKDDKLVWMFRGSCIAERKSAADRFTVHVDVLDGIFKDRLKLDHQTGSLTSTNTRTTHTGDYELQIIRPGKILIKRFSVSVFAQTNEIKQVSGNKGGSVTLETGVTDIRKDDEILWKFGYTPLAVVTGGIREISPFSNEIFHDRLKLDHQTGSLTIKKIRPTDAGIYLLEKNRGNIETKLFKVNVSESTDNRNNSENVSLMRV